MPHDPKPKKKKPAQGTIDLTAGKGARGSATAIRQDPNVIKLEAPVKEKGLFGKLNEKRKEIKSSNIEKQRSGEQLIGGSLPIGIGTAVAGAVRGVQNVFTKNLPTGSGGLLNKPTSLSNLHKSAPTTQGKFNTLNNRFPTNAKNVKQTRSLLSSVGIGTAAAGTLMSAIGSYPFAGFIKEEALQTLSFAVKTAKDAGDVEGEQEAINAQIELLDPDTWNKFLGTIPFANVLSNLRDFYDAAATKVRLDQTSLDRRREAALSPEDPNDIGAQIDAARARRQEEDLAEEQRQDERFATIREENDRLRAEGRAEELAQREEDSRFFETLREEARERKLREREEDNAFFEALRRSGGESTVGSGLPGLDRI